MVAKVLSKQEQTYKGQGGTKLKGQLLRIEPKKLDERFQQYSIKTTDEGIIYAIQGDYQYKVESDETKTAEAKQDEAKPKGSGNGASKPGNRQPATAIQKTCKAAVKTMAGELESRYGKPRGKGFSHENHFTDNSYVGTESCLGSNCHDSEANDVLLTGHWNWQGISTNIEGVEGEIHGKNDFINNFCVAVPTNEGRCAQCHIGYGYVDKDFDFTTANNIDCLICHDQTDTYKKGLTTGGLPDPALDLQVVARSVGDNDGVPGRKNCIVCHANAGGGDNVKHGDLAMSLLDTTREFDVHLGTDGADMT